MQFNFPYSVKSGLAVLTLFFALFLGQTVFGTRSHAQSSDQNGAVIFAYQRVGEDLYPSNNISQEQFTDNIRELTDGDYTILPLPAIVAALRDNTPLPDRSVAITFDGVYRSAFDNAIPILLEKKIPFTIFFSPDQAQDNNPQYIGWTELKRLARHDGVTVGLHPASYIHLTSAPAAEIRRQVNNALSAYRKEMKTSPTLFAYPFGEYTTAYREIIAASGFDAAFGQNSGAVYVGADMLSLPRFAITENYGDSERFRMVAQALPLPATEITPEDPHITGDNPPIFGFSVPPSLSEHLSQLSCFVSEQENPAITIVGKNRVEVRVEKPFESDRIRFNCTLPGPTPKPGEDQRWRWFGMLLTLDNGIADDTGVDDTAQ